MPKTAWMKGRFKSNEDRTPNHQDFGYISVKPVAEGRLLVPVPSEMVYLNQAFTTPGGYLSSIDLTEKSAVSCRLHKAPAGAEPA